MKLKMVDFEQLFRTIGFFEMIVKGGFYFRRNLENYSIIFLIARKVNG